MWPEPEIEDMLPLAYKQGPGRPRKVRIRESGEEGARKRRTGVAYKCTKCDQFGHNALTCKSPTQDPVALKRKRKVKAKVTEVVHDVVPNEEQNNVETEVVQNDDQDAVQNDVEPENVHDAVPNDVESQTQSCVVDTSQPQPKKKKTIKPHHGLKIRRSERVKLSWFKKPITGPGSSEQPITIIDLAETSSNLGVSTRSLKKWKNQKSS
ncbi:uncharacterized protein LOC131637635 [Vicia villosa]|uniref:uncharacterized protein LOC131637635 n=1 Tax=Vicia villosa TaxID=3911 RepID=UPI00273ADD4A|nr:uncharacterized protein LOC131637635 [Vicia villosa]